MPELTVDELLADLQAVLDGTGRHADHERTLAGRCVHCSCGLKVRYRGEPPAGLMATPAPRGRARRWQVRLADDFICLTTNDRGRADEVAALHDGAVVEPATVAPAI